MIYQKICTFYKIQFILFIFDTRYKMYWPCMAEARTISNGDVKIDLRRIGG